MADGSKTKLPACPMGAQVAPPRGVAELGVLVILTSLRRTAIQLSLRRVPEIFSAAQSFWRATTLPFRAWRAGSRSDCVQPGL
jgi:hypothetical protein